MYMRSVGEGKGLVPNYAHVLPACPYVKLFYEINIVIVHLYVLLEILYRNKFANYLSYGCPHTFNISPSILF